MVSIFPSSSRITVTLETLIALHLLRSCQQYKVPSVLSDDGILASDHRPVLATLTLETSDL